MSTPAVSVVIPVYNVANYIEKCAISLFEQTLEDIEFIFVDDCSPDNSINILENILHKYPERIHQTRIVRMETNSGSASVRKQGVLEAKGEYIIHCDSDDWVDLDLYEKLYLAACSNNADIVVSDFVYEYSCSAKVVETPVIATNGKLIIKNWYKNIFHLSCCNKLVKRSLYVDNTVYPWEGLNMWEDNGLLARLFYYAKNVCQIRGVYYHYNRTNENALTQGYGEKQINQMIGTAEKITEFFVSKPDAKDFEMTVYAFQFLARVNLITDSFQNLKKFRTTFKGSEKVIPYLDYNAFSPKGKIRFFMVKYYLAWLFVLLFKINNLLKL